ncbi:MAG: hypothetical protein NZT92_07340 [Abditibacteriales bacterium]|nr:hypothetical protein [Abditibacteriales bacterium]MDW8364669.1 hypothetical protein [Abditibacteriales bacterium]
MRVTSFLILVFTFPCIVCAADRSRDKGKETDLINYVALASVRKVAVVPFVALERPIPRVGFYSATRQEEEKKRWEEERAAAAEVARAVSASLPKTFTEWRRFEVVDPKVVEETLNSLHLKPSDLVCTRPDGKTLTAHAEGVRALRGALGVDAVLLGGADVRVIQYDHEVTVRVVMVGDDPAKPMVSASVAGRSHRRVKAAAQAALLITMLLYPSRDAQAVDEMRTLAVMVLPPPEALSNLTLDNPDLVVEAQLDLTLSGQLKALNHETVAPQDLMRAMKQLRLSPADLLQISKETAALPQVDAAKIQALAQQVKADGVLVAQILDVETTLSGTGMGLPSLIPYVGSLLRSPLFRHKSAYTVLRAQLIAPDKPYPIWTYITQGMPPRKTLRNPKYAEDLTRFFSDLSAQMIFDLAGQPFALPRAVK